MTRAQWLRETRHRRCEQATLAVGLGLALMSVLVYVAVFMDGGMQ